MGMSAATTEIHRRYQALLLDKQPKIELMEQIHEYFAPEDDVVSGDRRIGKGVLQGELLDTTASDYIAEHVAFVFGTQFVTDARWFSIDAIKANPGDDVGKVLARMGDHLFYLIGNLTNYNQVLPSLEWDVWLLMGMVLCLLKKWKIKI